MPKPQPSEPANIVYLFGAGATHAELQELDPELNEKSGLLISDVSSRVIEAARRNEKYLKDVKMVSGTSGSLNIELLITLLENSKIYNWEQKSQFLKKLVRKDIEKILSKSRSRAFHLHKALLEFHKHATTQQKEKVIGLLSLNYDNVLDKAFEKVYGMKPNYCFALENRALAPTSIPLLKLHGSFDWERKRIRGRISTIEIIPLGAGKNYLHVPYNSIWSCALEVLIQCDTLRVIGCSLSPNDAHMIDLLFKAHLARGKPFEIQVISSDDAAERIKRQYGFLPKIKRLTELEATLIPESNPLNPFKTWLKHKCQNTFKGRISRTKYIKKVIT